MNNQPNNGACHLVGERSSLKSPRIDVKRPLGKFWEAHDHESLCREGVGSAYLAGSPWRHLWKWGLSWELEEDRKWQAAGMSWCQGFPDFSGGGCPRTHTLLPLPRLWLPDPFRGPLAPASAPSLLPLSLCPSLSLDTLWLKSLFSELLMWLRHLSPVASVFLAQRSRPCPGPANLQTLDAQSM